MNKFINKIQINILLLILIIGFNSIARADKINDFEIERLSIGSSLLNFMSEKDIKKNIRNYVPTSSGYYVVGYDNTDNYDTLDIYLKRNDKNYIIKSVIGFVFLDFDSCKIKMDKVSSEIDQIFQNIRKVDNGLVDHSYDETGNSKEYQIAYLLKDVQEDDHIRLQCTDWSKKLTKEKNWTDSFNVGAYSKEILDWFIGGYK
jgi:hypothetical protein|tara:strand:- start:1417 stop:2022 length:606 start_codon:yes stop_codon:yes gene_type:complete